MKTAGLFDLQVNGYAGVDFNDAQITSGQLDVALAAMLEDGVTGCLPTVITAHQDELIERLCALDTAVAGSRLGASMVPGYHLEGPFLNSVEGYCGCHPGEAMTDPDVDFIKRLGSMLIKPILLLTLAPERTGSMQAIASLRSMGMVLAIAHSSAGYADVRNAADAGLTLSTHLGNGLPQQLPKLENTLLAQLAEPRLSACLIADGHHLSPDALAALIHIKGQQNCVLVTDAVLAASAPPGDYSFAGMPINLDTSGVVRQKGSVSLAGSALRLDQAIRNVCDWGCATPEQAIQMAGMNPRQLMQSALAFHGIDLGPGSVTWGSDMQPQLEKSGSIASGK